MFASDHPTTNHEFDAYRAVDSFHMEFFFLLVFSQRVALAFCDFFEFVHEDVYMITCYFMQEECEDLRKRVEDGKSEKLTVVCSLRCMRQFRLLMLALVFFPVPSANMIV